MKNKIIIKILTVLIIFMGFMFGIFAGGIEITEVRPSKILYFTGEPGSVRIGIINRGNTTIKGMLKVKDEWNIDKSKYIYSENINLNAGQKKVINVAWQIGRYLYGHALRASVIVNNKTVGTKAEFFQVALKNDWFRMFILNGGGAAEKPSRGKNPFVTYNNFSNHFSYAYSDFSHLAPEPDIYYSGQGRYRIDKKKLIEQIKKSHELGIQSGAYTLNTGGGPACYELARKHPEWFLRDNRGAFHLCKRQVSPVELAYPADKRPSAWYLLAPDFGNPEVVKYSADEIVRAIKMFDWDSVFFDVAPYGMIHYPVNMYSFKKNTMYTWDGKPLHRGKDPDALSAKILRRVRKIIRKSYPDVVLWYNGTSPKHTFKRKQVYACLEDSQTAALCELQGSQLVNPKSTWNNWRSLYEKLVSDRDTYMKKPKLVNTILATGYLYNKSFPKIFKSSRELWTMTKHLGSMLIATRYHPCLLTTGSWRPSTQFMTRYSAFLWEKDIKLMKKPWKKITVDSNREVWWEELVYTREKDSFIDTIIHIINSPEKENIDQAVKNDPPAARYVKIKMKTSGNNKAVKVWAVSSYNYNDKVREPKQILLKHKIIDNKIIVKVPPFVYHTMIVIRKNKTK
jgi:hypothetical protein